MAKLPGRYQLIRKQFPAVAAAYDAVSDATASAGPLDAKAVQMLKLGIAIGAGLESAAHSHTRRALEAGASRDELRHAGMLALTVIGFPRMMAGLVWIDDVLEATPAAKRKPKRSKKR